MADSKITALTALTAADPVNDMFPVVDVSDTSMAASGTTKKISVNNILGASGTATLASASITGAATVGTTLGVTGQSTLTGNVGVGVTPSAWGAGLKALQVGATGYGALFDFNNDVIAMSANLLWTGSAYNRISASSKYALAYYQDIGGSHQWAMSSAAGTNAVAPTMNTLMTLNANGNLVLKGGTAAANGVGVTFPATQVASSDANCLNDYEEGTFTPTIGGTATYTTQTGRYTKIGNRVHVTIRLVILLKGTGSSTTIGGLPFTVGSIPSSVCVGYFTGLALSPVYISGYGSNGSSSIVMTGLTAASSNITDGLGVIGNSTDLAISLSYEV